MYKMNKKISIILMCISLLILLTLIHEISHVLIGILLGNEWTRFGHDMGSYWGFIVNFKYNNYFSYPFICIAGSIGAGICSLLLIHLSLKRKNPYLLFIGFVQLFGEIIYWGISPFIKYGDGYNLYRYLDFYEIMKLEMGFYISIIFFIISIFISIWYYRKFPKIYYFKLNNKGE